jgi:hypothetical protein
MNVLLDMYWSPHPLPTETQPMPFHVGKVKLYYNVIFSGKRKFIENSLEGRYWRTRFKETCSWNGCLRHNPSCNGSIVHSS